MINNRTVLCVIRFQNNYLNTVEQKREKQTLAAGHVTWAVKSNTSFSCLSQELPKTKQNLFNSKDPRRARFQQLFIILRYIQFEHYIKPIWECNWQSPSIWHQQYPTTYSDNQFLKTKHNLFKISFVEVRDHPYLVCTQNVPKH